ncbi:biotin--[acetyl-CoA-carboxylase] ligase [bacterium]|nr:biotin--[acetyl-CoA-carboxylase] ligase [bacterium]
MTEIFDEAILLPALSNCLFVKKLYVFREIDSTNDFLKSLCLVHMPPEGTFVYAEKQTKGRGRFSRHWDSPEGKGLWFSCLFMPKTRILNDLEWTQLGVKACQKAIGDLYHIRLNIRWPNDLFYSEKKVGGVLTETVRKKNAIRRVVMGIGINVNQEEKDFDPSIRDHAISLKIALKQKIDRLRLLVQIVRQLEKDYLYPCEHPVKPF